MQYEVKPELKLRGDKFKKDNKRKRTSDIKEEGKQIITATFGAGGQKFLPNQNKPAKRAHAPEIHEELIIKGNEYFVIEDSLKSKTQLSSKMLSPKDEIQGIKMERSDNA